MSETPITAIDRSERSGSPGLVLLLAAALVAIAAAFSFLPPDQAGRLLKALLAVLAMVGVLALFAWSLLMVFSVSGFGCRVLHSPPRGRSRRRCLGPRCAR